MPETAIPPSAGPGTTLPTPDERTRAVCGALAWAPRLLRYAGRYTRNPQDAEDAYQRAMEIALTKAPVVEPQPFLRWLHVVLRNEAIAVASRRSRESAGGDLLEHLPTHHDTEAIAEWRQRHRELRDALANLTPSERVCVALHTAGLSHAEIADQTGFSARKVDRSLVEGRRRLREWEQRLHDGEECAHMAESLARLVDDESSGVLERRRVARHIEHCGACRGEVRTLRARRALLVATVPTTMLPGATLASQPPDPALMTDAWDRIAGASNVRAGAFMQSVLDLSGPTIAKVGATSLAAAVLLGAAINPQAGGRDDTPRRTPITLTTSQAPTAATPSRRPTPPAARRTRAPVSAASTKPASRPSARVATRVSPPVRVVAKVSPPATRYSASRRAAPAPPRSGAALEFGP